MKRVLYLVLFVLTFCLVGNGQKSDRERANLTGPVKAVREMSEGPKSGSGDTVTYDENGNEIERVMISDFGELMGKQTQTFNSSGSLQKSTFLDPKGLKKEESIYSYSNGKLSQILRFDHKGVLREKTVRTFDSSGNVLEEVYFDPNIARAKTVYKYDDEGNAIEMAFFLSDGQKAHAPVGPCLGAHKVTYTYDKARRPITKAAFETNGREKKSWTYSYTDSGDYLKYTIKSGSSTTSISYSYEYDSKGNWVKSTSVTETDNHMLELIQKATGSKATPEETQAFKDATTITRVTRREITYY